MRSAAPRILLRVLKITGITAGSLLLLLFLLPYVFPRFVFDKIFLTNAAINIQVDTAGHANYNIYAGKKSDKPAAAADSGSASLKIQKIIIEKSKLTYNDASL